MDKPVVNHMNTKSLSLRSLLFAGVMLSLAVMLLSMPAQAQIPCDGLKNPTSFSTNSQSYGSWSGQTGTKPYTTPVQPNITGMNMTSQEYTGNNLATLSSSGSSSCGNLPEPSKRFRIARTSEGPGSGTQLGKDPNTSYGLPYAPPASVTGGVAFTSSIRIGNCQTGAEAEGLYYTMTVRQTNALMTLYFAMVVQAPGHGYSQDPTFCIRVCRNTGTAANPVWTPISDTMSYFVSSTNLTNNQDGWHQIGSGSSAIWWREWKKVSINLMKYYLQKVRVEVYMGDCSQHGHYGYGYVAGDCQPVSIQTSGCPAGSASRVQTLTAPSGLEGYVWYRSDNDGLDIPNEANPPSNINFRRISSNSGNTSNNYVYDCTVPDFYCNAGTSAGQYTNNMVFRCDMQSRMNPTQPYWTPVYVRVINDKPMMSIDTAKNCDSWLQLTNQSYVPGDLTGCDTSISEWTFYDGSDTLSPVLARDTGAIVEYEYEDGGRYAVKVRSFNRLDHTCYTDSVYVVRVLGRPTPVMGVSEHELCEGERATMTDNTPGSVKRDWIVHSGNRHDTILEGDRNFIRGFENYSNVVEMRTYNGLWYADTVYTNVRHWCYKSAFDTIHIFTHPELEVTGDSVVCKGDKTAIHVSTPTEGCTYKWYRQLNGSTPVGSGDYLRVAPYADTSKYYVKVTSPQGCTAWDSVRAFLVIPTLRVDRNVICAGEQVTLTSGAADHYSWSASPADPGLTAQLDSLGNGPSMVVVRPKTTTVYSLVGHGTNGCSATPLTETIDVHPLPVARVSYDPLFVDSDNPVVTFSDVSSYGYTTQWYFPNENGPIDGTPYTYDFGEVSDDSVYVTLVSANDLGCTDTLNFRLPVTLFTYYAPNIFTPSRPDNNTFSLFTQNEMEHFHVHIYDRKGRLMYTSDDLHFAWDGTTMDGTPCPQGVYVYVATYRRPNTEDIVTQKGAITLVR